MDSGFSTFVNNDGCGVTGPFLRNEINCNSTGRPPNTKVSTSK